MNINDHASACAQVFVDENERKWIQQIINIKFQAEFKQKQNIRMYIYILLIYKSIYCCRLLKTAMQVEIFYKVPCAPYDQLA